MTRYMMGHTWYCPQCPGDIITSLVTAWLATLCSVCDTTREHFHNPYCGHYQPAVKDDDQMDLWFHISLLHRSCAGNVFCTHLPTFRTRVVYGKTNIRSVDMKGLWTHFHVWLRNVKSACDVWELCHKLLNCLNLQLCSVERSLNIILSLIFRCAGAGSTISWVMEPGWKGSTVPRYWLRSSCSRAGQWLTVC